MFFQMSFKCIDISPLSLLDQSGIELFPAGIQTFFNENILARVHVFWLLGQVSVLAFALPALTAHTRWTQMIGVLLRLTQRVCQVHTPDGIH